MIPVKRCVLLIVILAVLAGCSHKTSSTVVDLSAGYPDPDSPEATVFKSRCSECHVPPPPASRKARDWPQIVKRMQNHRIMNNFTPITDDEMRQVLDYLQKHSAG